MTIKKQETNLPAVQSTFTLPSLAVEMVAPAELIEAIDENDFGGYEEAISSMPFVSIRQKDLKDDNGRLKAAAGSFSISYPLFKGQIETPDVPTLTVTILGDRRSRVYFETLDDKQPKCKSTDGKIGTGIPGGECRTCPLGQFVGGQSPKCRSGYNILAWDHAGGFPYIIQLGPSGLRSYNQFRALAEQLQHQSKLPLHALRVNIGTMYVREPAEHYVPVFEYAGTVPLNQFLEFKRFRDNERAARMDDAAAAPTILDTDIVPDGNAQPADRQPNSDLPF